VRQLVLIVTAIIAGVLQSASTHAEGDAGSNWGKITEFYVDAQMSVMRLQFSREVVNPANCEGADFYVRELDDSEASDRFLRVVLAAHLANKKVEFWIDGCTRAKWWGKTRPQIHDIYIGS
jgi:hypothetical protein